MSSPSSTGSVGPTEDRKALAGLVNTGSLSTLQGAKTALAKNAAKLKLTGKYGGRSKSRRRNGRSYRKRSTRRRA